MRRTLATILITLMAGWAAGSVRGQPARRTEPATLPGGAPQEAGLAGIVTSAKAAVTAALTQLVARATRLDEQLAGADLKSRLESIEKILDGSIALARHLARRVEYLPGTKDPAGQIPILGPFIPGRTYLIVRQGTSALERYTVREIFGNGWIKVAPQTRSSPLSHRADVWLNAAQVVLAALDD
jgi:hypothetical protein